MDIEIIENDSTEQENDVTESLTEDQLKAELKKVRREAAAKRVELKEYKEKAARWDEYEESQKTELQKLQEALAEKEKALENLALDKAKRELIEEFGLEKDDIELLTGSDEDANRKIAEKLKVKNEKMKGSTSSRPADLLAGTRGAPVGASDNANSFDSLLRQMAKR